MWNRLNDQHIPRRHLTMIGEILGCFAGRHAIPQHQQLQLLNRCPAQRLLRCHGNNNNRFRFRSIVTIHCDISSLQHDTETVNIIIITYLLNSTQIMLTLFTVALSALDTWFPVLPSAVVTTTIIFRVDRHVTPIGLQFDHVTTIRGPTLRQDCCTEE